MAALRTTLKSMVLVYTVLEILFLSFSTSPASLMRSVISWGSPGPGRLLQTLQQHPFSIIMTTKTVVAAVFHKIVMSKMFWAKLLVAGIAAPLFVNQYFEIANRRWFWSQRKVIGVPLLVAALGMILIRMTVSTVLLGTTTV